MKKTATELGFNPIFNEMTKEETEMMMSVLFGALNGNEPELKESEKPFAIKMIEKRIEAMKLPIVLKPSAKIAMLILTDGNPGKMNVALIDIITKFEGRTISVNEICESVYPMGFYSTESSTEYIGLYLRCYYVNKRCSMTF